MTHYVIEVMDGFAVGGDGETAHMDPTKLIRISVLPDDKSLNIPAKYRYITLGAASGEFVGGDDSVIGQLLTWFLAGSPDAKTMRLTRTQAIIDTTKRVAAALGVHETCQRGFAYDCALPSGHDGYCEPRRD